MSALETGAWIVLDDRGAKHRLAAISDSYVVTACGIKMLRKKYEKHSGRDLTGLVPCYRCERIGGVDR